MGRGTREFYATWAIRHAWRNAEGRCATKTKAKMSLTITTVPGIMSAMAFMSKTGATIAKRGVSASPAKAFSTARKKIQATLSRLILKP